MFGTTSGDDLDSRHTHLLAGRTTADDMLVPSSLETSISTAWFGATSYDTHE